MIVVDTNVICYLLMPGERTAAAERLYRADPEWIAPRLWLDELLNVLATSERQAFLDAEQAAYHGPGTCTGGPRRDGGTCPRRPLPRA